MVEAAELRLRRVEDREAIRDLIARYGPLADAGEAQALAALWTEAGEYDVGGFHVARGRPAIAALIDAALHRALMADGCAHVLSAPAIDLDGDKAIAVNHSIVFRRNGDEWTVWRASANRWELARTPEGWRVARRVNRPLDGNPGAFALLSAAQPAS
ncbi:nuclear transport factor 2 family protein [Altererythrobacter aerius]|uniref:Nuclear transport factor 2 family protein n=1 Tax=Tsuneonella aeria TaxID=1837929 RepID=A0A6I4TA34_9SPHN|nr:nuclear transport factor 2 family protein [Tsuneonella aeria]MXO74379.1 nuclear transport factor 2 family protein [Tsuneonella aeria]